MKILLIFVLATITCIPAIADDAVVEIGMTLTNLKDRLKTKGIEVSMRYQLSIEAGDPGTELQFCNLDENITLVIAYNKDTEKVVELGLYFIPSNRTSKAQVVSRAASSITILESGEYVFKITPRKSEQDDGGKRDK